MTFLAPAMLWSLLVLAPLAAIYFLKVRPRRQPTTAYFLWEKIFQEKRTSSLFQRLRDLWSLLLMALAVAAICLALARPEWADQRRDLLIIIDHSASMGAQDGRSTRLESAQRLAADVIEGLNGNQRSAIATIGRRLSYLSHLTDNPRELLDAVEQVELTSHVLAWDALPEAYEQSNRWHRDHRVVLISDGNFGGRSLPADIELLQVGTPQENIGLVAADMAYLAGGNNRLAFYYRVASSFDTEQQCDLTVSHLNESGIEQLMKVIPLTVTSSLGPPEVFVLDDAPPGRWIARLEVEDALATDNRANLVAIRPPPIRVAVDAKDPFFFENSVRAFSQGHDLLMLAGGEQNSALTTDAKAEPGASANITLAKGGAPGVPLAIIFQPTGESPWWEDLGDLVDSGAPRVVVDGHPVLRHLDPTAISFVGARQLKPCAGAQVLVADENELPLIYKATRGTQTAVVVNIDPQLADFYFSAWFPVLVHSAATHLVGRELPVAASYRPGEAVPIPGAQEDTVTQWTFADPNGAVESIRARPDADRVSGNEPAEIRGKWWSGSRQLGFYELENDSGNWAVGVSLLAQEETLLGGGENQSTTEPLSRGRAPAYLLTILAIVALAAESGLYHRRKVG